jgi:hypothetical protein
MNEENTQNLIKEFLKKVKEKLPEWLKDKKEHKEILAELEEHIWNKAEELSKTGQPTFESVQTAIDHMGTPESIAKEYKRRGTPKFYITEELWPLYKNVLAFVFFIIVIINIIIPILNVVFNSTSVGEIFENVSSGLFLGFLGGFAAITVIFVALSMEGYFPEDFKSKKTLEDEERQAELAKERGLAYQTKDGKPLKPFISPPGEIIGGLIVIGIGLFLFIQPIQGLNNMIAPEFLLLVRFGSLFILAEGILDMSRGLIGNRQVDAHQIIHGITIVVKLSSISIAVLMMMRPEIFPILIIDNGIQNIGIAPEYYGVFRVIATLVIMATVLGTIENFYKIYKLQNYKV